MGTVTNLEKARKHIEDDESGPGELEPPSGPLPGQLAWLALGEEAGFCSPMTCDTHEGSPITEAEGEALLDGNYDPCVFVVRVWGA